MAPIHDLSDLSIDEVSVVKRGAIGKIWALFKANDDGDLELSKSTVDAMGTPVAGEEALVTKFKADGMDEAAVEAAVIAARLTAFGKAKTPATPTDAEMNENDMNDDNDDPDADDAVAATLAKKGTTPWTDVNGTDKKKRAKRVSGDPDPTNDLEDAADNGVKKNAPSKSADDVGGSVNKAKERVMADGLTGLVQKDDGSWDTSGVEDPAARSFYDNVLKSLDDAKAESATLTESVKKAEADNAELKDKLVVKEITAAVEGEYSKIAKAEDLVPVLKAAKDSLPAEQYEKLAEILKAANARIETGDLFAELGRSADPVIKDAIARGANFVSGGGDTWDQIVEKALAVVSKDGENPSDEQKIDAFLKTQDGQRMYQDYRAERGAVA
jgi:hypothetical protein